MTTIYRRAEVVRGKKRGKPGEPIKFVATTEGTKADGLNLMMDKLDLGRFEANPVIGYGHNFFGRSNLPIGRAVDIEVDAPALRLSVAFDQADEFATTVEQKVRDRYLNAMSVGFDVVNVDDETGIPQSWELFESSIVPIPLDPEALSEVGRAAVKDLESLLEKARAAVAGELTVTVDLSDMSETRTVAPAEETAGTPRSDAASRRIRLLRD